jgi:hypothetical protein
MTLVQTNLGCLPMGPAGNLNADFFNPLDEDSNCFVLLNNAKGDCFFQNRYVWARG